jgi:hypothetical protein
VREATERHAKNYNHNCIKIKGNCVRLCHYCHTGLHQSNQKNTLDWDYLMKNKKEEIIKRSERILKKHDGY